MAANPPATLELRNRMYVMPKRQRRWLRAGLWMLLALPVIAIAAFLFLRAPGALDWGEVAGKLKQGFARDPWNGFAFVLAAAATALQLGYMQLASRRERLVLTEFEIRYESPLPPALRFLQPGWALRWSELSRARLFKSPAISGPMSAVLVLETVYGKRKLRPYQWIDPEAYTAASPWQLMRQASSMRGPQLEQAIAESPLVRFVSSRLPRLEAKPGWAGGTAAFPLERSPRALALVVLFVALVCYAIVDSYVSSETYAGSPPYSLYALAGVLAGGLAWIWLRVGEVPATERSVVAFLFGVALAAALHPGLLRVNQLTDTVGLQTYRYTLEADLTLTPVVNGPPPLRFPRDFDYWTRFPRRSVHEFRLRKGALGFYQIDMAPVRAALRKYYWNNK